jgi:hypothetical protein
MATYAERFVDCGRNTTSQVPQQSKLHQPDIRITDDITHSGDAPEKMLWYGFRDRTLERAEQLAMHKRQRQQRLKRWEHETIKTY